MYRSRPPRQIATRAVIWSATLALGWVVSAPSIFAQTITGTVRMADTDAPVAGAKIKLVTPTDQTTLGSIRSNDDGTFTLSAPNPGTYVLVAEDLPHSQTLTFFLEDLSASDVLRKDIIAKRAPRFTGVMVDGLSGAPLPNARLKLEGTNFAVESDSSGRFRFHEIPPGRYPVRIQFMDQDRVIDTLSLGLGDSLVATVRVPTVPIELEGMIAEAMTSEEREWRARGYAEDYAGPEEMATIAEKVTDFGNALRSMGSPRIQVKETTGDAGAPFCLASSRKPPGGLTTGPGKCVPMLIILDGVWLQDVSGSSIQYDMLMDLNVEDIESVRVLTPIQGRFRYGSRGKNGVVIVETRSGGS